MPAPGDVGLVAKAFYKVFDWVTGEDGLKEFTDRREGESLEANANKAFRTWRLNPTKENWKAYKNAEQAAIDWSNEP